MKRAFNRRAPVFLGVVLLLIGGILWLTGAFDPEPIIYKGMPLNLWVEFAMKNAPWPEHSSPEARHIAPTIALPYVLPKLTAPDRLPYRIWSELWPRLPDRLMIALPAPGNAGEQRSGALRMLPLFGSNALPVMPILIKLAPQTNTYDAILAINALGVIGPSAAEAVPVLMPLLGRGNSEQVRIHAAKALWLIAGQTNAVLTTLIELAGQTNEVAGGAVWALKIMGPAARPAVPALIELVRNTHGTKWARGSAAAILGNLRVDSMESVSALLTAAGDSDPWVRLEAVRALWRITPSYAPLAVSEAMTSLKEQAPVFTLGTEVLGDLGADAAPAVLALRSVISTAPNTMQTQAGLALKKITNAVERTRVPQ